MPKFSMKTNTFPQFSITILKLWYTKLSAQFFMPKVDRFKRTNNPLVLQML